MHRCFPVACGVPRACTLMDSSLNKFHVNVINKLNSVGEERVLGRERAAATVPGEVILEKGDLVADVGHGGPERRRVLRAHEPELDELDDGGRRLMIRRVQRPLSPRRVREDGRDVVRVVLPHPVVQRQPLVEDHVRWPLARH